MFGKKKEEKGAVQPQQQAPQDPKLLENKKIMDEKVNKEVSKKVAKQKACDETIGACVEIINITTGFFGKIDNLVSKKDIDDLVGIINIEKEMVVEALVKNLNNYKNKKKERENKEIEVDVIIDGTPQKKKVKEDQLKIEQFKKDISKLYKDINELIISIDEEWQKSKEARSSREETKMSIIENQRIAELNCTKLMENLLNYERELYLNLVPLGPMTNRLNAIKPEIGFQRVSQGTGGGVLIKNKEAVEIKLRYLKDKFVRDDEFLDRIEVTDMNLRYAEDALTAMDQIIGILYSKDVVRASYLIF